MIDSPMLRTVQGTATDYWNDSCSVEELDYAIERGATGATSNPSIVLEVLKKEQYHWVPRIREIARRLGIHPAVVCIKWAVQRGQVPIPFCVKRAQFVSSLRAVVADPLTNQEMSDIAAIDRNCRLIKGQVFLWKEEQSWEDLWDFSGEITPP